jgi:hypothetical protein
LRDLGTLSLKVEFVDLLQGMCVTYLGKVKGVSWRSVIDRVFGQSEGSGGREEERGRENLDKGWRKCVFMDFMTGRSLKLGPATCPRGEGQLRGKKRSVSVQANEAIRNTVVLINVRF